MKILVTRDGNYMIEDRLEADVVKAQNGLGKVLSIKTINKGMIHIQKSQILNVRTPEKHEAYGVSAETAEIMELPAPGDGFILRETRTYEGGKMAQLGVNKLGERVAIVNY